MSEPCPPPSLSSASRSGLLAGLEGERFDLVVVGGGITGAGVARDGARRGLRVALVEGNDFAAGTSSRSSKLIHGGLRYLAMGDIGLVRETAPERRAVHQMAPHLAEPCWMVVPAGSRASLMKFRAGIGTYEKLGAVDDADRHLIWDRDALGECEPRLRRDEFPWACAYREYMTDDARLVLAVLRDAVAAGAQVAGRLPVVGVIWEGDRIGGVIATCEVTGERVEIRGGAVVNATGPWVEHLAGFEQKIAVNRLHPSKGIHVVVDAARLPVRNLMVVSTPDKRTIFLLPRGDTVAIGTTDTTYHGDQFLWPEIEPADVEYLLRPLERYFDVEPLGFDDVVAAWSGVRPLVAQKGKKAQEISRKEEVWVGTGGMITVAGGKLTGFRIMAMTVLDFVADRLGLRLGPSPGPEPLPGGNLASNLDDHAASVATTTGVARPMADRLVRLYGDETSQVLARGSQPVVPGGRVATGEIEWAVMVDGALTLEDLIYRRTRAAWYTPAEREALLTPAAARMAELLGWNSTRTTQEIETVRTRFDHELQFKNYPEKS
ncbi:FAD-dependent oxidoreductase [Candidatus Poriferisocius sp.]|uniref:glycerol-3-phosphate dehydrogenase/oxidase n=1 Tax=Candidatus Poriferisocius sp. TaxID=3101276 RepID=UPI003B02AD43